MGIDIRMPIGGLFTILGAMLIVYGFMTQGSEIYAKSLGINVNLVWGVVMLIFGVGMLVLGIKRAPLGSGSAKSAEDKDRVGPRH